jgi:hypothetical protein
VLFNVAKESKASIAAVSSFAKKNFSKKCIQALRVVFNEKVATVNIPLYGCFCSNI